MAALAPRGPLAGTLPRRLPHHRASGRCRGRTACSSSAATRRCALRLGRIASSPTSASIPAELHDEIRAGAALIIEDLPATPATLDWVFVSPALRFGAHMPGERLGRYRLGDDVAVQPEDGGAISAADYALGFVDLIEKGDHHRAQVNLGNKWTNTM